MEYRLTALSCIIRERALCYFLRKHRSCSLRGLRICFQHRHIIRICIIIPAAMNSTQSFSKTFNSFNEKLAAEIANTVGKSDGPIVEIGCGQGEFLSLLKERGCHRLSGFDPAYDAMQSAVTGDAGIEILEVAFDPGFGGKRTSGCYLQDDA